MIIAIDPGTEKSAYVFWDGKQVLRGGIVNNFQLMTLLTENGFKKEDPIQVPIEMVASYGMPVGKTVFETVFWIGRFFQHAKRCKLKPSRVFRRECKMFLCGNMKAKDSNIRQALIDMIGEIGTKKEPGPLYIMRGAGGKDVWSALAIAVTYQNRVANEGGQSKNYSKKAFEAYEGKPSPPGQRELNLFKKEELPF